MKHKKTAKLISSDICPSEGEVISLHPLTVKELKRIYRCVVFYEKIIIIPNDVLSSDLFVHAIFTFQFVQQCIRTNINVVPLAIFKLRCLIFDICMTTVNDISQTYQRQMSAVYTLSAVLYTLPNTIPLHLLSFQRQLQISQKFELY